MGSLADEAAEPLHWCRDRHCQAGRRDEQLYGVPRLCRVTGVHAGAVTN
jgi:hypothetical protein